MSHDRATERAMGLRKGALSAVRKVYDCVPDVECKGLCHDSCGPIAASGIEMAVLRQASGLTVLRTDSDLNCPLLDPETKRCTQYESRPLICRVYGVSRGIPCQHGCKPRDALGATAEKLLFSQASNISRREGLPEFEMMEVPASQAGRLGRLLGGGDS